MTNTKNNETKLKLSLMQKRALKSQSNKLAAQSKAQLLENRKARRFTVSDEDKKNPHFKAKRPGLAPRAARQTPAKGEIRALASKTPFFAKDDTQRDWYIIDADNKSVGRLSTEIATLLRGKHKATFTPHSDQGDFVVVINASKIGLSTQSKAESKVYYSHSGWISGLKESRFEELRATYPDRILKSAVRGMLPKNKLARQLLSKLKVYAGAEHPHHAQNPQVYTPTSKNVNLLPKG